MLIFTVRSINSRKAKLSVVQQNLCNKITENFYITPISTKYICTVDKNPKLEFIKVLFDP